jgi:hypothetical protein
VVKTDYLALGNGVLVTDDVDEAIADARAKLEHGAVVIEERLEGIEFSLQDAFDRCVQPTLAALRGGTDQLARHAVPPRHRVRRWPERTSEIRRAR